MTFVFTLGHGGGRGVVNESANRRAVLCENPMQVAHKEAEGALARPEGITLPCIPKDPPG